MRELVEDVYLARIQRFGTRNFHQYELDDLYAEYCKNNKFIDRETFIGIASTMKTPIPTICLIDVIRKRDGFYAADHLWIDKPDSGFDIDDVVEFKAEPMVYSKGYIVQTSYSKTLRPLSNLTIISTAKALKAYENSVLTARTSATTQKVLDFLDKEIKDGRFIG